MKINEWFKKEGMVAIGLEGPSLAEFGQIYDVKGGVDETKESTGVTYMERR